MKTPIKDPKLLAVGMNRTAALKTLSSPAFDWKSFRHEVLLWILTIASVPAFGFFLLRIATRINLP